MLPREDLQAGGGSSDSGKVEEGNLEAHQEAQKQEKRPSPQRWFQFGSCLEDLFSHSYSKPAVEIWLWVPQTRVLEAAEMGFLARREVPGEERGDPAIRRHREEN